MTPIFIITVISGIIIFDLFAYFKIGVKATISEVLYEAAKKYPIIPFAFGIVMGHLFWGHS